MMYANVFSFGLSMSRLQVVVVVICNVLRAVVWALRLLMVGVPLCGACPVKSLRQAEGWIFRLATDDD